MMGKVKQLKPDRYEQGLLVRALYEEWKQMLNAHLEEIDRSANEMFDLLMNQYAEREGVTEKLQASDQLEWVRRMNSIRECVEGIVNHDLVCM